jgi:response regulator RpfG family c-di-GMP phosphodiesterase
MTDTEVSAPAATPITVLFVDDEAGILSSLRRLFRPQGYRILTAESGAAGLETLAKETVDLVISDMRMPEMDGAHFLEQVRTRWPEVVRILLTGYADITSTINAINKGQIYRYISKPWDDNDILLVVRDALEHKRLLAENARLVALTQAQNEELKSLNAGLETKVAERTAELQNANGDLHQSFLATVQVFSSLIEMRERKLAGHSRRVAEMARKLAEVLGLDEAERRNVLLAGLLHDIGKVGLPDTILARSFNALTQAEKNEVMKHPAKAQQLLLAVPQLAEAAHIIRHHHECMDASGYPDKVGGLKIPLGARILAVANDYDGLQNGSLHIQPYSPREAQEFIIKNRGRRYDPTVVDAFIGMLQQAESSQELEVTVTPAELRSGMIVTRDLMHRDGYLLLPRGRVVDAQVMASMLRLLESEPQEILIHIRRGSGPAVVRNASEPVVRQTFNELALPASKLKEGMILSRSLRHREGYLLLASGNRLDEMLIRQLQDIETAVNDPFTIYIRVEDR